MVGEVVDQLPLQLARSTLKLTKQGLPAHAMRVLPTRMPMLTPKGRDREATDS